MEEAAMMSFGQLAEMFKRNAARAEADLELDLASVGALAAPMAAEFIGHELPQWPPLSQVTIIEKWAAGYGGQVSATDPLLRTGDLRNSIKPEVEGLELVIGSTDKVSVYQEVGTKHIPPRPFLGPAMLGSLDHAADRLGERAVKLLTPSKR